MSEVSPEKRSIKDVDDARLKFISSYTLTSLRLKQEKWTSMIGTKDLKFIILDWLDNAERRCLILTVISNGSLQPFLSFPSRLPSNAGQRGQEKSTYFIKRQSVVIRAENIRNQVIFGDVPGKFLQSFPVLLNEILLPLLVCPLNQTSWPDPIAKDIEAQVHELRNIFAVVKGNIVSQIILPVVLEPQLIMEMASGIQNGNPSTCDLTMKNTLEGMMIKWITQIHSVLNEPLRDLSRVLPAAEIAFWNTRVSNLESIYRQLCDPCIKSVASILECADSVYSVSFNATFKDVVLALHESRDISLYLNPLLKQTLQLSEVRFVSSSELIRPLVHVIYLISTNSKYYCTTKRITTLLTAVCNLLMSRAIEDLEIPVLFHNDPDEGYMKITQTLQVIKEFKAQVQTYQDKLASGEIRSSNSTKWLFRTQDIFADIEIFLGRLSDLRYIFSTAESFKSLEKIELGGVRGKTLTDQLKDIYMDFKDVFQKWTKAESDLLSASYGQVCFKRDLHKFISMSETIEKRLATILSNAFQDCTNIEQFTKLLQMTDKLVNRPVIERDVQRAIFKCIDLYKAELIQIESHITDITAEKFVLDKFFPPVAGTFLLIKKLRARISSFTGIEALKNVSSDEISTLLEQCRLNLIKLNALQDTIWSNWIKAVEDEVITDLNQVVLFQDTTEGLLVNFSAKLIVAMREVKCLNEMNMPEIPARIAELHRNRDEIWSRRTQLSRISEWYNSIRNDTQACEYDLIASELDHVDNCLDTICRKVTWKSYDMALVNEVFTILKDIYTRLTTAQKNIANLIQEIQSWSNEPLYRRNISNKGLIAIENREKLAELRIAKCMKIKSRLSEILLQNYRLLSKSSKEISEAPSEGPQKNEPLSDEIDANDATLFSPYQEYVKSLVEKETTNAVQISLKYIKFEMDLSNEHDWPLFEVKLVLQGNETSFVPSFASNSCNGFFEIISQLIRDILIIIRAASGIHHNFEMEFEKLEEIANCDFYDAKTKEYVGSILDQTRKAMNSALEYGRIFDRYSYLWLEDMNQHLHNILWQSYDNFSENEASTWRNSQKLLPTLEKFKLQLDSFNELYDEVENLENYRIFEGWLAVDMKTIKQQILNYVCKWSNLFKEYLARQVIECLKELEFFICEGLKVLESDVDKEDFSKLLKVMTIMMELKKKETSAENLFKPLKEATNFLKAYNVEIKDAIYRLIEELPHKWLTIQNVAAQTSCRLTAIVEHQRDFTNKKIVLFTCQLESYRKQFVKQSFFTVPCIQGYREFDRTNIELKSFTGELKDLKKSAELFHLTPPYDLSLRLCCKELKHMKQIWDFVYIIESCIAHWKMTPWKRIDTEEIENECKKFTRDLRNLEKTVRSYEPYLYLERTLKNMIASLRTTAELQNNAITERHWMELIRATKINYKTNESTTFSDLLTLNLHHFEEDVKNVVDKAIKELAVLKILTTIEASWNQMEFDYEIHDRRNIRLLKVSEELVETLEENQIQLQNATSSKHMDFLMPQINHWQVKLSSIDQVTALWFEVQRKWIYLENIFIGSEDIRAQLPDDSTRFENIDVEFTILLNNMSTSRKVLQLIEDRQIYFQLKVLLQELTLCEKALNNYLETKRLAFPRFYFLSSADLLDILSNGNQPKLIERHLTKLFDSISKLTYKPNSKLATGMIARENDEFVEFILDCSCSGKVEEWLQQVIYSMRSTLKKLFQDSLREYGCKSREKWLLDWPAQTALCCGQIKWTLEVNRAFARQLEGYENAMKDYQRKQVGQLNALITLLLGDLTPGDRQKIMTICTIDVHCRDVVAKIIQTKIESASAFQWQSQLRHRWDNEMEDCFANICDAEFRYAYEYLGNTTRLVITPLTDRCYITLTQSLHLVMGGAPAGPAGTGKTETIKDLGRALGVMVYVFNCSEQMDYKSCGNIYKGLAQTGAWGCFDEFNRISAEVLSVIAVQVKTIQDAIRTRRTRFVFMGEPIRLEPTVGIFITMNPGYAGRTELPENLKRTFRPCAMIVPDFALICEIMLVAEGFQDARLLARKFITLYTLCRELLSKQDHYDWGLRAIKSVLVVAGSLKRDDCSRPEDQVLMRALRDFNIPKIVTDDVSIFMGLISDLFPTPDVPRKRFLDFEKVIRKSALDLRLQAHEGFVLKVVQLQELLDVRHSVFIVGNAGTGKTKIWQTLLAAYTNQQTKPHYNVLNPKAITNDELFGFVNPTTREWRDGLFSAIMREQSNMTTDGPKLIILDGDIDPMWIESLNTLMDDNKILTLASNERITLKKTMRLLFEVGHLKAATPATVSRAGILYINPQDLGWFPYVSSWLETREDTLERGSLLTLFEKYIPIMMQKIGHFKKIAPISDIAMIQMVCHLLECLLDRKASPDDNVEHFYEIIFTFALVWGFGSTIFQDHLFDWRKEFHKWFTMEFKTIQFPAKGLIFDYCLDYDTMRFCTWSSLVPEFEMDSDVSLHNIIVPTAETTRHLFFLKLLMSKGHPVLLMGNSGSGKSTIFKALFNDWQDNVLVQSSHFNFYTTAEMFQEVLDKPLEKKMGRTFGPSNNKKLIYFVNDLNMPEVDSYGTVQPHTIIRQFMDYRQWYDKTKLTLKDITNCQFAACMNPTAGSFTIDPRLQRHFYVFAVNHPTEEILNHIYSAIFRRHLECPQNNFSKETKSAGCTLVYAGLALHQRIECVFLPTAVKFHYLFNLRDMTYIFQGLMLANNISSPKPNDLIRFYVHEATRVYHDRLMDSNDVKSFRTIIKDVFKKEIDDLDEEYVFAEPLIFSHFSQSLLDQKYMPIKSWSQLFELLMEAQRNYNESVGYMSLVMFEDAMKHICRINRILDSPRGNALLIGVGGSGKQTLSRLAAFISSLTTFQIQLKRGYNLQDMREDLAALYMKVGIKNVWTMFLLSDSQIPDESHLIFINDILASGEIPDLFTDDQIDSIVNGVRNEVKQTSILDTPENCWRFFIDKVQRMMKTVLCFSPVGDTLRIRARKFPAIINRTSIDWFHEWPKSALESVSKKFLSEIEILPVQLIDSASSYMAYVHSTVNLMSRTFLQNEKRYNYTTPKTFLEFISLFSKLLVDKTTELTSRIVRLESGMDKLAECARQVDMLQDQLAVQKVALNAKNEAADKLIVMVGAENEKVKREKFAAFEEERRVRVIEEDVSINTKMCEDDLRKAQPALIAAQEALNTLNKNNLTELKSFGSPPKAVINVCAAVMVLLAPNGKIPRDRGWRSAKLMMGKVDQFLSDLVNYDKDNILPNVIDTLQDYLRDPEFNPEKIVQKSVAAAGLCAWIINIHKYHQVFLIVGPKQQALQDSQSELAEARESLKFLKKKTSELEEKLSEIQREFEAALDEKQKCQNEADKTSFTINLAHRLVNGLANENIRWKESISSLREKIGTLPGDILLISSFLSYVGSFTRTYRQELHEKMWIATFKKIEPAIPHTLEMDPLMLISDDAQIAAWNNEGLPMDRMSTENAAILTNSSRWPLMIDPQLQGIKWIKKKYGSSLVIIRLSQKGYLDVLERAMARGDTVLIEHIEETVDAVLEPLLSRALIKKGSFIRIGDKEMDYNPQFKLILHTKLANPHYKPEMQAHTTLINFTVTRDGLEEQLLAEVVKAERADLEEMKTSVTIQQNTFRITLKSLEDELLARLASADKNVLQEQSLVVNLEETKKTVDEIERKVNEAKITTLQIDETRNNYRSAAERASILYFVLSDLHRINPIYVFSLKSFMVVFKRAISSAEKDSNLTRRVESLVNCITHEIFQYTTRGLFEKDKLTFVCHMVLQILIHRKKVSKEEIDFLLRYPYDHNAISPLDFLSKLSWGGVRTLSMMDHFYGLDMDIEGYPKRWKKFSEADTPEREKLPGEWKIRTPLQKLCIIRCLRPDRMTYAMKSFTGEVMGEQYILNRNIMFNDSFKETSATTPILFILSPGVDPLTDVERLGFEMGFMPDCGNYYNISLGQGQEELAEQILEVASIKGHWVVLQNIHLVAKWLPRLEKLIEILSSDVHPEFRLFITAEPASHPECHIIPQGIMESSVKIVNEPPSGMAANLHKAWDSFNQDTFESCSQEAEVKAILFSLCYFHAVVSERRKFGTLGWNNNYPFNVGDLTISAHVLRNYLDGCNRVPWEDLRYLFGEIMYGGHITDDWDRRLCQTYLEEFMQQDLIDGDFSLCPEFQAPPNMNFGEYHEYIDECLPEESPLLYGLHPNAEIGFLHTTSENLLKTLLELQPRESDLNNTCIPSREEIVKIMIDDILDKLHEEFNLVELIGRAGKKNPYIVVAFQECERMNILVQEIKRSVRELMLGLKGELTMSGEMETLQDSLFYDHVPKNWEKFAYPSLMGFQLWFIDLVLRFKELLAWSSDFSLPHSVWLGGLFSPQSFLTAIMQESARRNFLPLDKMCLATEVTRKFKDDIAMAPAEGAYINGLYLEGASWDCAINSIISLRPKELFSLMPVILVKAIVQEKRETENTYECPLYKTRIRSQTYVWTFNLKTRAKSSKWILGGVALLLQA